MEKALELPYSPMDSIVTFARAAVAALVLSGCTFYISGLPVSPAQQEPPKIEAKEAKEVVKGEEVAKHFFSNILPMVLEQNVPMEEKITIEFPFNNIKYTATFLIHINKEKKEINVPVQIRDEKGDIIFQEVLSLPLPPDENSMVNNN